MQIKNNEKKKWAFELPFLAKWIPVLIVFPLIIIGIKCKIANNRLMWELTIRVFMAEFARQRAVLLKDNVKVLWMVNSIGVCIFFL